MTVPVLKKGFELSEEERQNGFLLLVNKPEGWTSFDVCKKIRNTVRIKKVGHAGTLDPFATGLLLLGVGKGTKAMATFSQSSKTYSAVIQFGLETDSYDITGNIVEQTDTFKIEKEALDQAVKSMTGDIEQIPPMFSAKKVNGKTLYKYARKGVEIERKPAHVTIYNAQIKEWNSPCLKMDLHVSKGTYIRAYAHDLGKMLNVPAVLKELQRNEIGDFRIEDSFSIEEFCTYWAGVTV